MTTDPPTRSIDPLTSLEQFAELWESSAEPPDAGCYLSHASQLTPPQVLTLVLFDQRQRWPRGCGWPAEKYFELSPSLGAEGETATAVVYNEFLLREASDRPASEEECLRRFPDLSERLRLQFDLHRALAGQRSTGAAGEDTLPFERAEADGVPPAVPGYAVLTTLGRGGMGVVYQARHLALNRVVALKMILDGGYAGAENRVRFRHEAETLARLQHPNIVQIYDVGEHEGRPFLALEYVAGGTLCERAAGVPQAPRWAALVVEVLARAVHVAHLKGFIHRDLKPTNILLTPDGAPKVTDFGLARDITADSDLTQSGLLLGTPSYMAPEQASGRARQVGTAADVYALGAILYELLTGRPPFRGETPYQTVQQVMTTEPVPPRGLQPTLPRDLETVCLKCLQKRPDQRYATAEALAEDLTRFLDGRPILARPVGSAEQIWRWCRRNPQVAGLSAAVFGLVLTVAVGSSVGMVRLQSALDDSEHNRRQAETSQKLAENSQHQAEASQKQAEKSQRRAEIQRWETRVEQARAMRLSHRPGQRQQSLRILRECVEEGRRLGLPPERFYQLRNDIIATLAVNDLDIYKSWKGFPDGSRGVDFDAALETYARTDEQNRCSVRRVNGDVELFSVGAPAPKCWPVLSPDGRYLALYPESGGTIEIWDLSGPAPKSLYRVDNAVSVYFAPKAAQAAVVMNGGAIDLLDLPSSKRRHRLEPTQLRQRVAVAWHPSEHLFAVSSYYHSSVEVREIATGRVVATAEHKNPNVAWHPNGRDLLIVEAETGLMKHVELDDKAGSLQTRRVIGTTSNGSLVAFAPSGDNFACVGWDSVLRYYDFHTGQLLFQAPNVVPRGLPQFDRSGHLLAGVVRPDRGEVLIWTPGERGNRERRMLFTAGVGNTRSGHSAAAVHPNGRLLAAGVSEGVSLFDVETGREIGFIPNLARNGTVAQFDPAGALLTSSWSGTFRWKVEVDAADPQLYRIGPAERLPFPPGTGPLACSPDGRFLTKVYRTGYSELPSSGAWVWDTQHQNRPPVRLAAGQDIGGASFSPNGEWLALASRSEPALLYRVHDGGRLERARSLSHACERVCFSPTGQWLWAGSNGGRLLDTQDWQSQPHQPGQATFSPDGRFLASSTREGCIRLVDLTTGREVARFEDPELDESVAPTYSPDGSKLIAPKTLAAKGVQVWDLRSLGEYLRELGLADDWPTFPPAADRSREQPLLALIDHSIPPLRPIRCVPDSGILERKLSLYSTSLALLPLDPEVRRLRGEALMQFGELDLAIEDYELAWLLHPSRAQMNWLLGRACHARARELVLNPSPLDPKRGLQLAERACALLPGDPQCRNTLGIAQYRNGLWDEAIATLQLSLKLGRGRFDALDLYFVAMSHQRRGETDKARQYLEQARAWLRTQKTFTWEVSQEVGAFDREASVLIRSLPPRPSPGP